MAPDPRVSKAYNAMKVLGIPWETVKPVLKHLLKLYGWKWELIEEDNYRTLADAIFERADDEGGKKRDSPVDAALEPALKRPHLAPQEDVTIHPRQAPSKNIEMGPISSQLLSGDRNVCTENASRAFCSTEVLNGSAPCNRQIESIPKICEDKEFSKPKPERSSSTSKYCTTSTSDSCSGSMEVSFTRNNPAGCLTSEYPYEGSKKNGSVCGTLDIVSSSGGEIRISLNCFQTLGQPCFHNLSFERVLKLVEAKYVRLFKGAGTQFSVMKLLKDLCENYLKLATCTNCISNGYHLQHINSPGMEYSRALEGNLKKKVPSSSRSPNSLSLVDGQQQCNSPVKKKSFHKISDITKGTEKQSISLLDEVGNDHLPNFVYVPQNIIYQNAYIHVSLARIVDEDCCSSCIGNCLSSSVPCACARDTGGEFAYSPQGQLTEKFLRACLSMNQEPQNHYHFYCQDCPLERAKNSNKPEKCKGHLVRKFIKECWRKCGCNMQCGNRVVQRGITFKLQVFLTNGGKGWGVRTLEELPKGSFVCEYVGEILTNMELYERNKRSNGDDRHTYPVLLDADWGSEGVLKDEDALCLDATVYGNVARFINHRCFDANLIEVPVEVETPDHHYYHLAFFTKRKVGASEELTWDYGIDFDDRSHPIKAFKCCCGSEFCRDTKGKGANQS